MQTSTVSRDHDGSGDAACYRVLREQIRNAGLLSRRRGYYGCKIAFTVVGFAAGWLALFAIGNSWVVLPIAAFLAVMFTQVVFVGHDAGHQQIFRSPKANRLVGLFVGNALTGLSFGWWVPKHNAHHTHPNQIDRDPDIGSGAIIFTDKITERSSGFGRWLARWQAWLFFPLLALEAVALHVASVGTLGRRRDRAAIFEGSLLIAHTALYLTVVFWVLSPVRALVFIAVQQGLFGLYLGCTFAPNHKGMTILDHDSDLSFAHRQVITARNLRGGRFTTFMLGGLNYQIEHHLFPTMPRPNLARAQPFVREFCVERGWSYREDTLIRSYWSALRYLNAIGARDRRGEELVAC
jgi:fatty acid desaturase